MGLQQADLDLPDTVTRRKGVGSGRESFHKSVLLGSASNRYMHPTMMPKVSAHQARPDLKDLNANYWKTSYTPPPNGACTCKTWIIFREIATVRQFELAGGGGPGTRKYFDF